MELNIMYQTIINGGKGIETEIPTLREKRISLGYSVEHVADVLSMSPSMMYRYERNPSKVYPSVAVKIAQIYGVTIDDLSFT